MDSAGADGQWLTPDVTSLAGSAVGNPYLFTGRRYDTETRTVGHSGLYYYRARVYHPDLMRFCQPDPIGYADSMNLYAYSLNDPVNLIDSWGLRQTERYMRRRDKIVRAILRVIEAVTPSERTATGLKNVFGGVGMMSGGGAAIYLSGGAASTSGTAAVLGGVSSISVGLARFGIGGTQVLAVATDSAVDPDLFQAPTGYGQAIGAGLGEALGDRERRQAIGSLVDATSGMTNAVHTISGAQTTLEVVSGALDAVGAAQEGHEAAQILKSGEKGCDRN